MNKPTVGTHTPSGVPATAGTIAHTIIADLMKEGPSEPVDVDRVDCLVRGACEGLGRSLNGQRVRGLALTSITKYLALLRPTAARFVGAEVALGTGRADLVWLLSDGAVFIDELKTARYLDEGAAIDQATRYATAANTVLGDAFVGVRVISTTQERRSLLVTPQFTVHPLAVTPLAIPALRGPVREVV